MMRKL